MAGSRPAQFHTTRAPPPAPPPRTDDLPHALTIYLTAAQRRRVIAALKKLDRNRGVALCQALGLHNR